eukprot:m.3034 g.3034  ORF g.3034 m.3034 type:complete len:70 (-) comp2026_c0_seq2:160-369(-)
MYRVMPASTVNVFATSDRSRNIAGPKYSWLPWHMTSLLEFVENILRIGSFQRTEQCRETKEISETREHL